MGKSFRSQFLALTLLGFISSVGLTAQADSDPKQTTNIFDENLVCTPFSFKEDGTAYAYGHQNPVAIVWNRASEQKNSLSLEFYDNDIEQRSELVRATRRGEGLASQYIFPSTHPLLTTMKFESAPKNTFEINLTGVGVAPEIDTFLVRNSVLIPGCKAYFRIWESERGINAQFHNQCDQQYAKFGYDCDRIKGSPLLDSN